MRVRFGGVVLVLLLAAPVSAESQECQTVGGQKWILVTTIGTRVWREGEAPKTTMSEPATWLVEVCDIVDVSQDAGSHTLLALRSGSFQELRASMSYLVAETPREICEALAACGAAEGD